MKKTIAIFLIILVFLPQISVFANTYPNPVIINHDINNFEILDFNIGSGYINFEIRINPQASFNMDNLNIFLGYANTSNVYDNMSLEYTTLSVSEYDWNVSVLENNNFSFTIDFFTDLDIYVHIAGLFYSDGNNFFLTEVVVSEEAIESGIFDRVLRSDFETAIEWVYRMQFGASTSYLLPYIKEIGKTSISGDFTINLISTISFIEERFDSIQTISFVSISSEDVDLTQSSGFGSGLVFVNLNNDRNLIIDLDLIDNIDFQNNAFSSYVDIDTNTLYFVIFSHTFVEDVEDINEIEGLGFTLTSLFVSQEEENNTININLREILNNHEATFIPIEDITYSNVGASWSSTLSEVTNFEETDEIFEYFGALKFGEISIPVYEDLLYITNIARIENLLFLQTSFEQEQLHFPSVERIFYNIFGVAFDFDNTFENINSLQTLASLSYRNIDEDFISIDDIEFTNYVLYIENEIPRNFPIGISTNRSEEFAINSTFNFSSPAIVNSIFIDENRQIEVNGQYINIFEINIVPDSIQFLIENTEEMRNILELLNITDGNISSSMFEIVITTSTESITINPIHAWASIHEEWGNNIFINFGNTPFNIRDIIEISINDSNLINP